jgi:hypothetical protein
MHGGVFLTSVGIETAMKAIYDTVKQVDLTDYLLPNVFDILVNF